MLHPLIILTDDHVVAGEGLVATGWIRKGEIVSQLEPNQPMYLVEDILTWPPEKLEPFFVHAYQCSETHYVSEEGIERFMNHSCDPNTWWLDDDTLVARRDIAPREELTYDYSTTEIAVDFAMECLCGSPDCRGVITNKDYLDPAWQKRFGAYLPAHTRKVIATAIAGPKRVITT